MALQLDELAKRPGIVVVGSSNVGKRTLLSRLLDLDFEDASDSSAEVLSYGWTINTKYYTADVSIWMVHLDDGFSTLRLPVLDNLVALVMVFDLNDLSSFETLQDWVSRTDLRKFDIMVCIGNKADLLPGHFAHSEYRKRLQKHGSSSNGSHNEFLDFGILDTEGSSLLGDEKPSWDIRRSCLDWCIQNKIEYVEACAANAEFDKCLSIDGDSQGVERLYGALSAHMWPGMVLKSGDKIAEPYQPEKEDLSEEESDFELEYEILSAGSAEPWDDTEDWVSANNPLTSSDTNGVNSSTVSDQNHGHESALNALDVQRSIPKAQVIEKLDTTEAPESDTITSDKCSEMDGSAHLGFEDLEHLMNEIGNMRQNVRLMPDFQRREMAAMLAMKMASMFGDGSSDEEGLDR
ncbi:hypothetical protein Sjap_009681 [Stephania japonica]|uniref:Uncharacterized protein n=1 Tax=Stephania japonica TaxID=461633 RepID=A0AAP0J7Z0_9MAGN